MASDPSLANNFNSTFPVKSRCSYTTLAYKKGNMYLVPSSTFTVNTVPRLSSARSTA